VDPPIHGAHASLRAGADARARKRGACHARASRGSIGARRARPGARMPAPSPESPEWQLVRPGLAEGAERRVTRGFAWAVAVVAWCLPALSPPTAGASDATPPPPPALWVSGHDWGPALRGEVT